MERNSKRYKDMRPFGRFAGDPPCARILFRSSGPERVNISDRATSATRCLRVRLVDLITSKLLFVQLAQGECLTIRPVRVFSKLRHLVNPIPLCAVPERYVRPGRTVRPRVESTGDCCPFATNRGVHPGASGLATTSTWIKKQPPGREP